MSIKLVSWNVNGIRAVSKKDEFWDWFENTDADIINFQEVRATQDKIPKKLADVDGYKQYFNEAEKKGYSGVGTYSKIEPVEVTKGLGVEDLDSEGRVLKIEYPDFILYNIYFPNSGMNAKRLDFKVDFCNALLEQLVELKNAGKNIVITGDYNIYSFFNISINFDKNLSYFCIIASQKRDNSTSYAVFASNVSQPTQDRGG